MTETSNDLMSAEDASRLLRFMDREDANQWTASEKMLYVYAHTVEAQALLIDELRGQVRLGEAIARDSDRQAEQIATARALAEGWRASVEGFEECKSNLAVATALATQAACGDAILKALGVSGE